MSLGNLNEPSGRDKGGWLDGILWGSLAVLYFGGLFIFALSGCGSLNKLKRTTFYKNDRPVKTFVGRGVFDGNDWFGDYKIWARDGWKFYQYKCIDCKFVEEVIEK